MGELYSIIAALAALTSAVASIYGIRRNNKIEDLQEDLRKVVEKKDQHEKELYKLYCDVEKLLEIEKNLSEEADVSKIKAREGYFLDRLIQPSNVKKRINELGLNLNSK